MRIEGNLWDLVEIWGELIEIDEKWSKFGRNRLKMFKIYRNLSKLIVIDVNWSKFFQNNRWIGRKRRKLHFFPFKNSQKPILNGSITNWLFDRWFMDKKLQVLITCLAIRMHDSWLMKQWTLKNDNAWNCINSLFSIFLPKLHRIRITLAAHLQR